MEHRWGTRQPLDVGIRLYVGSKPAKAGRLLNASSSGAYVATNPPLPIMTRVQLALGWDGFQRAGRRRIAAYVVRSDARGVGIEWQDFAPLPVPAMIDTPATSPSQDSLNGVRTTAEASDDVAYTAWRSSSSTSGAARSGG